MNHNETRDQFRLTPRQPTELMPFPRGTLWSVHAHSRVILWDIGPCAVTWAHNYQAKTLHRFPCRRLASCIHNIPHNEAHYHRFFVSLRVRRIQPRAQTPTLVPRQPQQY